MVDFFLEVSRLVVTLISTRGGCRYFPPSGDCLDYLWFMSCFISPVLMFAQTIILLIALLCISQLIVL